MHRQLYVLFFVVLQSNGKGSRCSSRAAIVLPQVGCRLSVPSALGISTNWLDKPFAQLRLVQRGLDKLASCCCYASFFQSCVFKAGPLLPHLQRFTFVFCHWCHALCMLCVSQWVWPCGQGSWHRIRALNWLVCALVLHTPPTLHPCKYWTAGCRNIGTMENQKGWTHFWPTWGPSNDRQGRWTRLSFSLHFYIVWMWVSATIPKHRKGLASAWALVTGHCFHVFSIKHCSMSVRWT